MKPYNVKDIFLKPPGKFALYLAMDRHLLLLNLLLTLEELYPVQIHPLNLSLSSNCPDDPELLSEFIYLGHGGQSFPQFYRATVLHRDKKVTTICVVTESHVNSQSAEYFSAWGCKEN